MKKVIEIVILGNLPDKGLIKKISKWKSKLFEIKIDSIITNLPRPNHKDIYLNQNFRDSQLSELMGNDTENLRIGIIFADLENDFYVRRVSDQSAVISIKSVQPSLNSNNISIENFLKRNIYEIFTLFIEYQNAFSFEAYKIPHIETRGCLFDLNGDITDVIYNTEKPIICQECNSRLSACQLPNNFLKNLKQELRKIRKRRIERIELFIKKQPFVSILITVLFGITLNIVSCFIYDAIKNYQKIENDNNEKVEKDK